MIPVRAEEDVFIFQLRIGAVDSANDIPRFERANFLFDVKTGAHGSRSSCSRGINWMGRKSFEVAAFFSWS